MIPVLGSPTPPPPPSAMVSLSFPRYPVLTCLPKHAGVTKGGGRGQPPQADPVPNSEPHHTMRGEASHNHATLQGGRGGERRDRPHRHQKVTPCDFSEMGFGVVIR